MPAAQSKFEAERAELQALLDSGIFSRSPNLHKFLAFVCEKYFSGNPEDIKEYSVAVEALGRPSDFDQKRDSIVRVEAYRLRKRLDEYYNSEGANHPIRIQLTSGSYIPKFTVNPAMAGTLEDEEHPPARQESGAIEEPGGTPHTHEGPSVDRAEDPAAPPAGGRLRLWHAAAALLAVLILAGAAAVLWDANRGSGDTLTASAADTSGDGEAGPESSAAVAASIPAPKPTTLSFLGERIEPVRILAGSRFSSYVDRLGNTWTGDAYFEGGNALETKLTSLYYTAIPEIYAHHREGQFSYAIPLPPGHYELRLHFVEPIFGEANPGGGGEASRLFHISLNGERIFTDFDILADAFGGNNANVKVLKDVQPAQDGKLHLSFEASSREVPVLSALEAIPAEPGRIHPIRIVANERGFTDTAGRYWSLDHYVNGGRYARRPPVEHPDYDAAFFTGERYGNFTYMIPVAQNGRYRLRLHFCERWWGPETICANLIRQEGQGSISLRDAFAWRVAQVATQPLGIGRTPVLWERVEDGVAQAFAQDALKPPEG